MAEPNVALYRKTALQPMRPYVPGEDLTGVSVSPEDTPELGGMIAWNPDNSADMWYVAKKFFEENYEVARVDDAPRPSVGRVVHYASYGTPGGEYPSVCRAAVVTAVFGGTDNVVGLCVMNPEGLFFNRTVPFGPDKKPGTWHWPERVGEA